MAIDGRFEPGHTPANKKENVDHGSVVMYWRGCRCGPCTEDNTRHYAALRGTVPIKEQKLMPCIDCGVGERLSGMRICRICRNEKARIYVNKRNRKLTDEQRELLLQKQGYVCAICKQDETSMRNGCVKELAEDHCHELNFVRGLLCQRCNMAIGLFKDNPELLNVAAYYLRSNGRKF